MAPTTQDVYDVLKSIDATLKTMAAKSAVSTATDADLDGQYGDPVIKAKDPRDWTGEPQTGKRFSQCPAPYLDLLAERLDYFATQAEAEGKVTSSGKPVAPYNRKDAARARGWAARIRGGWKPPDVSVFPSDAPVVEDDIPF